MKRLQNNDKTNPVEEKLLNSLDQTAKEHEKRDFGELYARIEAGESKNIKEPKWRSMKPLLTAACTVVLLAALVLGATRLWGTQLPVSDGTSGNPEAQSGQPYYDIWQALRGIGEAYADGGDMRLAGIEETMMEADTGGVQQDAAPAAAAGASEGGADYGETNVQVAGVDEADIVKNDGEYLYVLGYDDNGGQMLSIVHAESMTLRHQQLLDGGGSYKYINAMYVTGDFLTLVGSGSKEEPGGEQTESSAMTPGIEDKVAASSYYMEESTCYVQVYRLSGDRSQCEPLRYHEQSGAYSSSRMVDGTLYLVSSQHFYIAEPIGYDGVQDYLPYVRTGTDAAYQTLPADRIDITENPRDQYTQVSAVPVSGDGEAVTRSVLGSSGDTVYSSTTNLYTVVYGTDGLRVMRFSLEQGGISEPVTGEVPGDMLNNQFSMDEYNGYFRIVTTKWTDNNQVNRLYVLDSGMKVVGESDDLAPGETVYSVRFMGDMAYVVTFMQVDPLFAIDLSDPENPEIKGQLKIPGFSTYMHPIDADTLIGVGYDADEESGTSGGLKVSLFDVSDPLDPKETDKLVASGDVSSIAAYEHKAFTYIADRGILILPVQVYNSAELDGKTLTDSLSGGALILQVTKDGIRLKGTVADPKTREEQFYGGRDIQRTTYIGGTLYTVSMRSVMAIDLETLTLQNQLDLYEAEEPLEEQPEEPLLPEEEIEPFVIYD